MRLSTAGQDTDEDFCDGVGVDDHGCVGFEVRKSLGFDPADNGLTDGWRELFRGMCAKHTSVILRDGPE